MHRLRRTPLTLLFAGLTALYCAMAIPAAARNPATIDSPASSAEKPQPYLDRKVESTLEQFSRWKARMKQEHFAEYLVAYSCLVAGVTGLLFGFASYRLSDPMSTYRTIRRRTLQLALAIGAALGVLAAVLQVPPNTTGKVSLLFLAIGTGAVATPVASWLVFFILRFRSNHLARRDGRRVSDRMWHL